MATPDAPIPLRPLESGLHEPGQDATVFAWRFHHPDGLAITAWDFRLRTGVPFFPDTVQLITAATHSIDPAGRRVIYVYSGPAITNPVEGRLAWRARVRDELNVYGPWSDEVGFLVGAAIPDPYDRWAPIVLDELADPRPGTVLGTLRPTGPDEVLPIVTAELGDRWQLVDDHVSPAIDRTVRVLGLAAKLTPADPSRPGVGGLEVNATTEDLEA